MRSYSESMVADILSVSKRTVTKWKENGKLIPEITTDDHIKKYSEKQLMCFDPFKRMVQSNWKKEQDISPLRSYTSLELFAGSGGLAIGLEKAGFHAVALNEMDKHACHTLRYNRPQWNVLEGDIKGVDFSDYHGKVDLISGGFPCQSFSYAGKKLGFEDTRGTLFFEFARVLKEVRPTVFIAENVRGLSSHDSGRTLKVMTAVLQDIGYRLVDPKVLRAIFYRVPQKRERLIIVGVRKDIPEQHFDFSWPEPYDEILTVKDALKAGELYPCDVPNSEGQQYPKRKAEILSHVPRGGYWRDLPDDLQREYMKGSYFLGGGKTGMARRLSWNEPCLTLTCAPAQKQTERCHPDENRPLKIREYARIQTFPDDWRFMGSLSHQYKQIGNAVPINLSYALGKSLIRLLNSIEKYRNSEGNTRG